jgi:hypothetical protein
MLQITFTTRDGTHVDAQTHPDAYQDVLIDHFQHKSLLVIGAKQYLVAWLRLGKVQGGVRVVEVTLDDKGWVATYDC